MSAPWKSSESESKVVEAEFVPVQGMEAMVTSNTESQLAVIPEEESDLQVTGNRTFSAQPKLKADELRIPRLRLAQGQTPEVLSSEAKAGQWILSGNEPSDEIEVVVLAMGRARELWTGPTRDDRELTCKSADAVVGEGDPGGPCDTCPMAQWTTNPKNQKRQMPACDQIYSYQVYCDTYQALAILEFRRTGLDAAKMINTMIATRGMANFTLKLSGQKRQNGSILYYIPHVVARPITPDMQATAQMFVPTT